jgi:hypothetical protein
LKKGENDVKFIIKKKISIIWFNKWYNRR